MRYVLIFVGIVVLALLGVGAYVVLYSGNLIKQAIEAYGPEYLNAGVTVNTVDLSLVDGTGELRGFQIDNPAGYDGPYAMRVERMLVVVDTEATTEQVVVLKEVNVDGASLHAIARGTNTNFQQLLQNVERNTGGPSEPDPQTPTEEEVKVIIDRFHFTNAKTQVTSDLVGEASVEIPDIHLKDVGRKTNGATAGEVLSLVLKPVTRAISREVVRQGAGVDELEERLKAKAGSAGEKLGDRFKKLLKRDE